MKMGQDGRSKKMVKGGVAVVSAVVVLVCGVVPAHAWWRVWVGPPYWGYPYAPPVVVEPPAPVVVQPPPTVVQPPAVVVPPQAPQAYAPPDAARDSYYYCESAKSYYPYVKECPQGWTRVAPQPTAGATK